MCQPPSTPCTTLWLSVLQLPPHSLLLPAPSTSNGSLPLNITADAMVEAAYQGDPARPGKDIDEHTPAFSLGLPDKHDGKSLKEEEEDLSAAAPGGFLVSHPDKVICIYLSFSDQKQMS